MALKDARIGRFVGSGRGGGILTVYDSTTTKAQIRSAGYWNQDLSDDQATLRERTAVEDFIAAQQSGSDGVIALAIGNNGAENEPYVATLTAAGRVAAWDAGT